MARMCIALGMSPAEYYALTVAEHAALAEEFNRQQRKKG